MAAIISGEKPLYRPRAWEATARSRKKQIAKVAWCIPADTVLRVPYTPGSELASLKATVENPRAVCKNCTQRRVLRVLTLCYCATQLQNLGGCATSVLQPLIFPLKIPQEPSDCPAAQCRHPRHSPEETVIPIFPKDFKQLLRLKIS